MVQPFWWNVSVSVGVSWNGKTDIFFIDPQKNKSGPELLVVTENDCMRLESRMEARFSTFSANCCDWISISCSETCWTIGYFAQFGHPILFVYFTVKTKAYKVIISHAVQLWLLFKTVISFCLNSNVKPYNITAKLGTFFVIHPVYTRVLICHFLRYINCSYVHTSLNVKLLTLFKLQLLSCIFNVQY